MKHKKIAALILSCAFALSGCGGAGRQDKEQTQETQSADAAGDTEAWQKAEESPYAAYPELVTYTLGQMSGVNNSNLPDGDTYEDNVYTRYLRKMLNIQNDNAYMEREDRYDEFINILVKDQTLPDVLVVSDRETLKELVENDLVEDLSDVYESCTTTRIKEMFESYGSDLLDAGKFNGKLMAIPETVIDHGPRLLWLRKDWMDELGLDEPKTLDDAFEIIEAFVENGMGTEEGEDPVGLVCDTDLVGSTSSSYSVEPVSIADLNMQLGFLWEELQGYTAVMDTLKKAGSVRAASDAVLTGYEKPADQSETAKKKRAEYGEGYYKKYAAGNGTKYYRVRKSWTDAASQLGAFTSLENAKSACKAGYTVYDDNGKAVYTAAGQQASAGVPFSVQVDILDLNIRTGAGTNYAKTGETTGKGVFTIVEVKAGQGASAGWGRLKSGAGWISLDYATRLA